MTMDTNPSEKSVHGGQSAADRRMAAEKHKAKSKVRIFTFSMYINYFPAIQNQGLHRLVKYLNI